MLHQRVRQSLDHETTTREELQHLIVFKSVRVVGLLVLELLLALCAEFEVRLGEMAFDHEYEFSFVGSRGC